MLTLNNEATVIHQVQDRKPLDVDAVIKAITTIQAQADGQSIYKERGEVKINTESPVLLVTMSDLHVGNQATDHARILKDLKTIRDTPNTFVTFNGDLADNLFVFRKGGAEEGMTAEMQGLLVMEFMSELDRAGKIVSIATGNHDGFVDNFYRTFSGGVKAPLYYNWGDTRIQVGNQTYNLYQFHEITMGNSTMSHLLREVKALEMRSPDADIVLGGHTHRKAIEEVNVAGKRRILIEAGTYKINDAFQVGHGNARFGQFDYCGASVLLFPDTKRMIPFYDLETGVEAVTGRLFLKQALMKGVGNFLNK